jgi:hypothetical protein
MRQDSTPTPDGEPQPAAGTSTASPAHGAAGNIKLPPPRPILWPLRPAESAEHQITNDSGQLIITITHAPLRGVTAEMLQWWFRHVAGTMSYAGGIWPRYLVWHPLDHISYDVVRPAVDGGVGPGAKLHIVEALGRNSADLLNIRVRVDEIGEGRAVIAKRVLGTDIVCLENEFADSLAGATYNTRLRIGDHGPLGRLLLNHIARHRAFPPTRIQRWVRHHIEEIGNLENFLPDLFRERADQEP